MTSKEPLVSTTLKPSVRSALTVVSILSYSSTKRWSKLEASANRLLDMPSEDSSGAGPNVLPAASAPGLPAASAPGLPAASAPGLPASPGLPPRGRLILLIDRPSPLTVMLASRSGRDGDRADGRVRVVVRQVEVLRAEVMDVGNRAAGRGQGDRRERSRLGGEHDADGLHLVGVDVRVGDRVVVRHRRISGELLEHEGERGVLDHVGRDAHRDVA